jgi:hypothetical protein
MNPLGFRPGVTQRLLVTLKDCQTSYKEVKTLGIDLGIIRLPPRLDNANVDLLSN